MERGVDYIEGHQILFRIIKMFFESGHVHYVWDNPRISEDILKFLKIFIDFI